MPNLHLKALPQTIPPKLSQPRSSVPTQPPHTLSIQSQQSAAPQATIAPPRFAGKFKRGISKALIGWQFIIAAIGGYFTHREMKQVSQIQAHKSQTVSPEMLKHSPAITFQYFVPVDHTGKFKEAERTAYFEEVEKAILTQFATALKERPDLLNDLMHKPGGLNIKLYKTTAYTRGEDHDHLLGDVTNVPKGLWFGKQIRYATEGLMKYLIKPKDHMEVTIHELAHVLDGQDAHGVTLVSDGIFPFWSKATQQKFIQAREVEQARLKAGTSPLRDYAGKNDLEFLAVSVETYFDHPEHLKKASKPLYEVMEKTFSQKGMDDRIQRHEENTLNILIATNFALLLSGGIALVIRPRE